MRVTALALSLLKILDKLDPGASRNRGKILKDLIKPYMKLAEYELSEGIVDEDTFRARKVMAQHFAKDLIQCYKYETLQ